MSTPFPVLSRNDHNHKLNLLLTVLRSESCSGYTDVFGNWNTGFYCPQSESKAAVYCCGTETYKYCCTAKDPNDEGTVDVSLSTPYSIRTPLIIGIVSGLVFIAFFVTLATCFFCPCCLFHKKRTANIPSGLYRLQCGTSSTTSPLVNNTNSHSSNLNSFTRLPLDYGNGNFYGQQQSQPQPQHPEEQNFGYPTNGFHFHPGNSFSHNPNPMNMNVRNNSNSNVNASPSILTNSNNTNGFLSNPGSGSFVQSTNQYDQFNGRNLMQNMNQTQHQQNVQNSLSNQNQYNFGPENSGSGRNDLDSSPGMYPYPPSTFFLPRCRASYSNNELTGSPCFSNANARSLHLERQQPQATNSGMTTISYNTTSRVPYNYSNSLSRNSSCNTTISAANPGGRGTVSRNSFPNIAFSNSTPQVYVAGDGLVGVGSDAGRISIGVGSGDERIFLRPKTPVSMTDNKTQTVAITTTTTKAHPEGVSKSVHFADGTPNENGNGISSPGNGFTTPVTTRMTAPSNSNSPSTLPSALSQKFSTLPKQNGQVKFSGLPLSTSFQSTEPPVTSFCEILTVL